MDSPLPPPPGPARAPERPSEQRNPSAPAQRLGSLLTSTEVKVASVAALTGLLTIVGMPAEKQALWTTFVVGLFGLASAVVVALGYARGKLYEGALPPGWRSVKDAAILDGDGKPVEGPDRAAAVAALLKHLREVDPHGYEAVIGTLAGEANAQAADNTARNPDTPTQPGGGTPAGAALILLPLLAVLCGGCTLLGGNRAAAFAAGIRAAAPLVAAEYRAYVAADAVLADPVRAARLAAAAALEGSAAASEPDPAAVAAAWAAVRPEYVAYVLADARLTAADRAVILRTVADADALIAAAVRRRGP